MKNDTLDIHLGQNLDIALEFVHFCKAHNLSPLILNLEAICMRIL